jgi:hypothetical protein
VSILPLEYLLWEKHIFGGKNYCQRFWLKCRFLSIFHTVHCFLPKIAGLLTPLHAASSGQGQEIEWTEKCQTAFEAARSALAMATLLHHPQPDSATSITTDIAVGAQLEQLQQGK